jgi:hypothetical protein
MKKLLLTFLLLVIYSFAGGPFDHAVDAFQYFNKPLNEITIYDRFQAMISHAKIDAIVAENGKNLTVTQAGLTWLALQKAKSVGRDEQFKMAYFHGNFMDMIDKGLTGGVIRSQLEQVPFVGELLAFMVPSLIDDEIIHAIPGYPKPQYQMTEHQYYVFQGIEFLAFWFQLDQVKVRGSKAFVEIKL